MKKVSYFIVASLFAVSSVFVSCSSDDDIDAANISFDNVTDNKVTLPAGATSYTVNATITSIENLKSVKVLRKIGNDEKQVGSTITSFPSKNSYNLKVTVDDITQDCDVIVAVDNGTERRSALSITVTEGPVTPGETPLSTAETFSLVYKGSNDNANVNTTIGIKYGSNASSTAGKFTVEPSTGNNFVEVASQAAFDAITTKEALKAAYDGKTGTSSITAEGDAKFVAKYFISKVGDNYFKVKLTGLKLSAGNNKADFSYQK